MSYPRILIFSQTFNNFSGGGITLTNLFDGWPKERVAVISYHFMLADISFNNCERYYQLGDSEIKWKFPFSRIKKSPISGPVEASRNQPPGSEKKTITKKRLTAGLGDRLTRISGLEHMISSIYISPELDAWLAAYEPELLYFQISNRESIAFAELLIDQLKIPSVIHMMDDWPATMGDGTILRSYWRKKIGHELGGLMDKVDIHCSICDEMSSEYKRRFGHEFHSFHNTIDLDRWGPFTRRNHDLNEGQKVILFSGRIGRGIEKSLFDLAEAVELLNREGLEVRLKIQSPRSVPGIIDRLKKYRFVTIASPVSYEMIPQIYAAADVLAITNDFSREGIRFLKYSMPTKVPEYMISGTPILVYASAETALFKLFRNNNCGHCISTRSIRMVADGLRLLLENNDYRKLLAGNAVSYAVSHFDAEKVKLEFQDLLRTAGNKGNKEF